MKNAKKFLSLVLTIFMLAAMLQIPAFAAEKVTIKLVPEKTVVEPGETVKVDIVIENNTLGLSNADFYFESVDGITYSFKSLSSGSEYLMANTSELTHDYVTNAKENKIVFSHNVDGDECWIYENGKLAYLNIVVAEDAPAGQEYTIGFASKSQATYYNEDWDIVPLNPNFVGATVTVAGASCDHTGTETTTAYAPVAGSETHTVTVTCACVETISTTVADCEDNDQNGKCDQCGRNVACKHTNTSESTEYVIANETHTPVTKVVCGDCGETVSTTTGETASCGDNDKNGKCDTCGGAVKVEEEISGLTASIEGNQTVEIGDTAQVKLFINSDNADEVYNAFKFEVSYDASVLTYSDNSFTNEAYNVSDNGEGKLIIDGYGDDIKVSGETELVTLDFTAKADGEGEVEITKAFANDRGVAITSDIQPIDLSSNSVAVVTVNAPKATYTVTFEGNGAGDANGASEVTEGDDYTFTVTKKDGYTYEISATMGGEKYELNGGYTIENVTGNIVITVDRTSTGVEPDPDSYPVTLPEDVAGNNTATEGEDYTFTVPEGAGVPNVTIDGETIEIGKGIVNNDGSVTYTIPADMITGAIVVALPAVEITVEVSDYFKFDGGVMKLVVAKANLGENKVLTYDTNAMYWSDQYQGYAYLVHVNAQLTEEEAKAMVAIADGNAASIDNGGDVNESGVIDINDAQLTYDIYKAEYNDFTSVSMKKMLRADVNNDREVNVNDVTAVVAIVRN